MDRRLFLSGITSSMALSNNGNALAKDFSTQTEKEKLITSNRFDYTSYQIRQIQEQQQSIIENNILPKNYGNSFWDQPRTLSLKRSKTNEIVNIPYFKNGQVDLQGYWKITYLLRDLTANLMAYPDLKLLDLLCAVQAWMKFYGNNNPLIITSGFRTKEHNNKLEGAAKDSQHLLGKAVDFVVPGLDPQAIGKIASHFQAGGVGIYLDKNFTHLDTGNIRSWIKYPKK